MQGYIVNVSNISNQGSDDQIREYLQLVGPIKQIRITREERRVMARVAYFDSETAAMAVKFLGGSSFKARDLKINGIAGYQDDQKQNNNQDDEIFQDLANLKQSEKSKFALLISGFAKEQGDGFTKFLIKHKKITEGLINMTKY